MNIQDQVSVGMLRELDDAETQLMKAQAELQGAISRLDDAQHLVSSILESLKR